jgi:exopolyphosphatase/guanosine-5'-triphosphate,3'-diphosphate pyrophosphatase
MEHIVPRWEWRAFGDNFGAAEPRFKALPAEKVQTSEEVYLLASTSDANVKIRDRLLDIKILERVDSNGLEQWRPVLKAPFPLADSSIAQVRAALGLPGVSSKGGTLSLDRLITEWTKSGGPVRKVNVKKTRTRYHVEGCVAELTDLVVDGIAVRTVAIEDADPAKVIAAVSAMGLAGYLNTSYPCGLRQVVDRSPAAEHARLVRQAVIDVGTNSVKFYVGERQAGGIWTRVVDRAEVTRLGEGIQETGAIAAAAIERTASAISQMVAEARQLGVDGISAVGTMGLRTASNSQAFRNLVKERSGVAILVISGEQEGRLAYLAVKSGLGLDDQSLVIFDSGGGSTQFTFGRGTRVDRQFSLNVGAVRYTERFRLDQAVGPEVLGEAADAMAADLAVLDQVAAPDSLVAMGGAVTNMAAVMHRMAKYDPDIVQGSVIERREVDRQIEQYRAVPAEARRQFVGLQPKRAEVILAGACIVRTVMEKLRKDSLSVSDRGLRHGLLIDRFGGQLARSDRVV